VSTQEIIIGIGAGLLVNEFCDISPWAARKIVVWSARLRYGKSARAEVRAEEHVALIDSRPGKLFKLITALAFAAGATRSYFSREMSFVVLLLEIWLRSNRPIRPTGPREHDDHDFIDIEFEMTPDGDTDSGDRNRS
jgi:hypothetical protein